jgi:hypothetical protein
LIISTAAPRRAAPDGRNQTIRDIPEAKPAFRVRATVGLSLSELFTWDGIPAAHEKMLDNKHLPGSMDVLVCAQRPGLRTFEEVQEISAEMGV